MSNEASEDDTVISEMVTKHLARMNEISDEGLTAARTVCEQAVGQLKRYAGLKATILEKKLEAVGILEPQTEATDES